MSGVILLSGCDHMVTNDELLTKKEVFELKQYCINSGADSYRLSNPGWVLFKTKKDEAKITNVICIYNDEENEISYEVDSLTVKKRDQNGN